MMNAPQEFVSTADTESHPAVRGCYETRPSAIAYTVRSIVKNLRFSPTKVDTTRIPRISLCWNDFRLHKKHLTQLETLTKLDQTTSPSILAPHILGFRLVMAVLTHPDFPLPLQRSLQIRNHLVQHHRLDPQRKYVLNTSVVADRVLEKGLEIDLYTSLCQSENLIWESLNTFYYRGRSFGSAGPNSPLAKAPTSELSNSVEWTAVPRKAITLGRLTGDFNPLHFSIAYARRFGFPSAFFHPPHVVGQCLAHLPMAVEDNTQRLDVWLKGPVFYSAPVRLMHEHADDGCTFALALRGESRPCILGRWYGGREAAPLGPFLKREFSSILPQYSENQGCSNESNCTR